MLRRFDVDVIQLQPQVVVILGGTNDIIRGLATQDQSIRNMQAMIAKAQAAGIQVVVGTLPPVAPKHPTSILQIVGSAALALAIVLASALFATQSAQAQTFTTLANIDGDLTAGLVQDAAGNFYGTIQQGGVTGGVCGELGCGLVFKVDPVGTVTVLHSFTGGADGEAPQGSLVLDAAGNLYGTTWQGGVTGGVCGELGCGMVFKLDPIGTLTVLYSFTGGPDGAGPQGSLVQDAAGNLYGTTSAGGLCNCGTVFKLDPVGALTVLHGFTGGDGAFLAASLVLDAEGNLYGTAEEGRTSDAGIVFKLDSTGKETVLYSFTGGADGGQPVAGLILDAATGNLYGTTSSGGLLDCFTTDNSVPPIFLQTYCGVVFKLDPTGKETVLHSFTGPPDGEFPQAGLAVDTEGSLYGTTFEGGTGPFTIGFPPNTKPGGNGTVFKVEPTGKEAVLYSFTGGVGWRIPASRFGIGRIRQSLRQFTILSRSKF